MNPQETVTETKGEVTLESLQARMDMFGEQMNWLCENLQSLFVFVNAVGAEGGGIRGLMSAMKKGPSLNTIPADSTES
jgi:hypothetical protein